MEFYNIQEFSLSKQRTALITGSTGALGGALVQEIMGAGWNIVLQHYKSDIQSIAIREQTTGSSADIISVRADLTKSKGIAELVRTIKKVGSSLDAFVHCVALPVHATQFDRSAADSFIAHCYLQVHSFLNISEHILPVFRYKQHGVIIGILTEALLPPSIPGWTAYRASKMALASVLSDIAQEVATNNVRVVGVLPGAFSRGTNANKLAMPSETKEALRLRWPIGTLPVDVARLIIKIIEDSESYPNGVMVAFNTTAGIRKLQGPVFEPWIIDQTYSKEETPKNTTMEVRAPQSQPSEDLLSTKLEQIFRSVFRLGKQETVTQAEIGAWPPWDSLKHLELLMKVESSFGVDFSDKEGTSLTSFAKIVEALSRKGIVS